MVITNVIPNITLGQLKRCSHEKRLLLMHYLSLRGEIYVGGIKKLANLRNQDCIKKVGDVALLVVNVIDSYYDEPKGRIVFITDLIAKDDGQRIVADFYLSDLTQKRKEVIRKPYYRKSDNCNHVAVRTSFELPISKLH